VHSLTACRASVAVIAIVLRPAFAFAQQPAPEEPAANPASSAAPSEAPATPSSSVPPVPSAPSEAPKVPARAGDESADIAALRDEVRALRAEMESDRAQRAKAASPPPTPPRPLGYEAFWPWVTPPEGLSAGAYVQAQYEAHDDSTDQLAQDGTTLNQDRFSIRRARASLLGEWQYAALALELDANTTSGPQVDLRKAEASVQYRPDRTAPPLAMVTLGLFDAPFGYELVESPRTRFFMERSVASRAFFPGEPDLGVRVAGAWRFLRWTVAAQNGEPLGEKSAFVLQDPNQAKDVFVRLGFDATPLETLHVAGDLSALKGKGFHAGTPATKSSIQWSDANENGIVDSGELTAVPARAATPSQNFDRWAVGLDVRTHLRTSLGVTKLYGELVIAQNLDRGLYIADPVLSGIDQREIGAYVGVVQDITRWGVVGIRLDYYDPNSNAFDNRAGRQVPYSQAITTVSPLVGLVLPDRARLVFQYDIIQNAYALGSNGVPTNLKDNVATLRLQVQL
jgi:hypothetical protein